MRQHPTRDRTVLILAMLFAGILTVALRSVTVAQSATPLRHESFDEAGVRAAVSKRIEGRTAFSARLSAEPFADDAVWINAFGRWLVGRANIEKFFTELYADRGFVGGPGLEPTRIVSSGRAPAGRIAITNKAPGMLRVVGLPGRSPREFKVGYHSHEAAAAGPLHPQRESARFPSGATRLSPHP